MVTGQEYFSAALILHVNNRAISVEMQKPGCITFFQKDLLDEDRIYVSITESVH